MDFPKFWDILRSLQDIIDDSSKISFGLYFESGYCTCRVSLFNMSLTAEASNKHPFKLFSEFSENCDFIKELKREAINNLARKIDDHFALTKKLLTELDLPNSSNES